MSKNILKLYYDRFFKEGGGGVCNENILMKED